MNIIRTAVCLFLVFVPSEFCLDLREIGFAGATRNRGTACTRFISLHDPV